MRIGLFDSGVGGFTVLKKVVELFPNISEFSEMQFRKRRKIKEKSGMNAANKGATALHSQDPPC